MEINVNDINPRSTSLIELAALEGYNVANGKGMPILSSLVRATSALYFAGDNEYISGRADAFAKKDFIPAMMEMMETQRYHGNWEGYMRYKEIIDSLFRR